MVGMGVSQRDGRLFSLLDNFNSTLSTAAFTYFSDYIVQKVVPLAVSAVCIMIPIYMSGISALSPCNLNNDLIPSIVYIRSSDMESASST